METHFCLSMSTSIPYISQKLFPIGTTKLSIPTKTKNQKTFSLTTSSPLSCLSLSTRASVQAATSTPISTPTTVTGSNTTDSNRHWIVLVERPPQEVSSKKEIIDYYVKTLQRVLGSEKEAQMCIYDTSFDDPCFGFCCDVDEKAALGLASLPGILSVRPDPDYKSEKKDYSPSATMDNLSNSQIGSTLLFPLGSTKHWLVRMDKPGVGVVTKAQMVDYYTQILTKVLGNEKDAQMCIYHVSWQSNFGFCCELDDECAEELAGVPGVLSVQPDKNFKSEKKDYGGDISENTADSPASSEGPIRTKKLFITGLSFYTSEKTLRAAFEGFGELVEVKIIMDKISKRSKGYAFVEYTTEEAASAALKEMNGKIINGWMIVVDVAKSSPKRYRRGRPRPRPER